MSAVEFFRKIGCYSAHVSAGVFDSTPLTGKKSSAGFFATWYSQFTAKKTTTRAAAPIDSCTASGAARHARISDLRRAW